MFEALINIRAGMEANFLKYDLRKIDHLGAEYDTCSVMHYGAYAFAKVTPVLVEIPEPWQKRNLYKSLADS